MSHPEDKLQPVVETRMALDWLASYSRDRRVETSITGMGERVRVIAPDCIALSLGVIDDGLTFTLVAETPEVALLDAIQYLDGGPCVAAAEAGENVEKTPAATDEERWQLFARGQSFLGVGSTLSLPIMVDDRVVCGVNLYASTPDAFDDHHEELAQACGAWAQGVVTNADLSFTTRLKAAAAPARLREMAFVDGAAGFLAAQQGIDIETAMGKIRAAAARAGVREPDVAKFLLDSNPEWGL